MGASLHQYHTATYSAITYEPTMLNRLLEHLDGDHRFLFLLASLSVFVDFVNPAVLIFGDHESWTHKVAHSTSFPVLIGVVFLLAALSFVPNLIYLATNRCNRLSFKLATLGGAAGSFSSVGMAYLARNMDVPWFTLYYLSSGLVALLLAGALAASLNRHQSIQNRGRQHVHQT